MFTDRKPGRFKLTLDQVAFGCLWAFVMALPWEGRVMIGGFVVTWLLGLLAFAAAGIQLFASGRTRPLSTIHIFMAGFVCWAAASLAWTVDLPMTLSRTGSYIQMFLMVWLIWNEARTGDRIASLLHAYCLGTCVSSIQTILYMVAGMTGAVTSDLTTEGRYAPVGFDENELALMLALSIPMSLYLLGRRPFKAAVYLCWAQLILATTAILLTGSRAGFLCLLAAGAILPHAFPRLPGWNKWFCGAALAAMLAAGILFVPQTTWERLLTIGSEVQEGTLNHRTVIWAAGLEAFDQHPLLGVGAGAFGPSVAAKIDRIYVAHNSFLSILVELGIVGALWFVFLLAGLLYLALHMPSREKWLWTIELLTWSVGVSSLTWEYRKVTWLIFGLVAAQAASVMVRHAARQPALGLTPVNASLAPTGGLLRPRLTAS